LGQAKALFDQARAYLTDPKATSEQKNSVGQLMEDGKKLQAEAEQLKDILEAADKLVEFDSKASQEVDKAKSARKSPEKFKNWGEFLTKTWLALNPQSKAAPDPRLQWFEDKDETPDQRKDMGEATGQGGGFLVPGEFEPGMQAVEGEQALFVPRATRVRMRRRNVTITALDQTTTTAGVPHWFGGILFYHGDENTEKTESDPKFRQVVLTAWKLFGYTRSGDELMDDEAVGLGDFFTGPLGFAGGAAWIKDYEFLRGTGAGQPLGVINAGATITVARQAVATPVQYLDLVNMFENFLPSGKGMWAFSQSVISNLLTIQDPNGNYIWLPNMQNVAAGIPTSLFGYPINFTEKAPRVGTAGDCGLYDWRYYLHGDRQASTIESTKYDRWRYDQTSWRMVARYDGRPWLSTPLTYEDGTTQVSPFVILGDKST